MSSSSSLPFRRTAGQLLVALAAASALYSPVLADLARAWEIKPQYSHGYLIVPIALYLAWQKRERLRELHAVPSGWGMLLIGVGVALYLLGSVARVSTVSNLSLMLNVLGIVLAIGGRRVARELLFPILFLLFMFPIPDNLYASMTAPLKLFVSGISVNVLQGLGIAVYREGNILQLPNITLEVVEACSGLRSFMSYLMLCTLFAYHLPRGRLGRKALLLLLTLPISVLINVVRIVTTGLLANRYGPDVARGFFHEFSGISLFALGFVLLGGVYLFLRRVPAEASAVGSAGDVPRGGEGGAAP